MYNFDGVNWTNKSNLGLLDLQISWELPSLQVVLVVKCTLALPAEECLGAVYDYLRIMEAAWLLWESCCKKRITTREALRGRTTREFTICTKKPRYYVDMLSVAGVANLISNELKPHWISGICVVWQISHTTQFQGCSIKQTIKVLREVFVQLWPYLSHMNIKCEILTHFCPNSF